MSHPSRRSPFLEQLRAAIRVRHYSIRTEGSYVDWTVRFIKFHDNRHPGDMGETEVAAFLTHLATERRVVASTQNQALNALTFMYRYVIERPLAKLPGLVRAWQPQRPPGATAISPSAVNRSA
jgi:site-specific recombinase XerD